MRLESGELLLTAEEIKKLYGDVLNKLPQGSKEYHILEVLKAAKARAHNTVSLVEIPASLTIGIVEEIAAIANELKLTFAEAMRDLLCTGIELKILELDQKKIKDVNMNVLELKENIEHLDPNDVLQEIEKMRAQTEAVLARRQEPSLATTLVSPQPVPSTPVMDLIAAVLPALSNEELRVLIAVATKTEFKLTGLEKESLGKAVKALVSLGIITRNSDTPLLDTTIGRVSEYEIKALPVETIVSLAGRIKKAFAQNPIAASIASRHMIKSACFAEQPQSQENPKTFPQSYYATCIQEYERLKGITLGSNERKPILRDLKLLFQDGYTPEQICQFMNWLESQGGTWKNWKISTVRNNIHLFVAGKLSSHKEEKQSDVQKTLEMLKKQAKSRSRKE